jgi:Bacterial Ig domain
LQWPPVNPAHITIVPTRDVNLTVAVAPNANQAPMAVNDAATTAYQRAVIVPVLDNDTDADNDILTVSAVTQGANGAVTTNGITATYTPMAGFAGNDSFSYTVVDGKGGVATANVMVTVNPQVNFAPVANTDNAAVIAGSAVTIAVLANDTDANGDMLMITGVTQGVRGTVVRVGNNLVYTALAGPAGVDIFTYTITDGNGGNATGTVNVTVGAIETGAIGTAQFR